MFKDKSDTIIVEDKTNAHTQKCISVGSSVTNNYKSIFERKRHMFSIIQNQQTPKIPEIDDTKKWIEENKDLIQDFFDFTKKKINIVGLAANQLENKLEESNNRLMARMFCSKASGEGDGEWKIFINPKIIKNHGEPQNRLEGCLTWPEKKVFAKRYLKVDVEWWNIKGEKETKELSGWEAQVWQHEQDHLEGVEEEVVDRNHLTIRSEKVGRNEPCPCGKEIDGKPIKYKKCCGKK